MRKGMLALALTLVFGMSAVTTASAARLKCTVDTVEGDKVTMTCEKADKLAPGDKVKVSPPRKGAAIEGC